MAEFPALPLWTDAYLGDTTHLTTIEHGAYLLLLMAMWRNNGKLPDDDKLLARYARLTAGQWARVAITIRAFFKAENGCIYQGRLTDELDAVRQHSKRQSDNVKARWRKTKEKVDTAVIPETQVGNTPLPLPIPVKEVSEGKPSLALLPKATRFDEFWNVYPHRGGAKKGRKPAEARYASAVKAGVSEQDIIDGAKRSAKDRQVMAGFARDPTTWLNQSGWEDEIDVSREGSNNGNGNHNAGSRPGPHNALMAGFAMAAHNLKN